jgi:hypothetical protein
MNARVRSRTIVAAGIGALALGALLLPATAQANQAGVPMTRSVAAYGTVAVHGMRAAPGVHIPKTHLPGLVRPASASYDSLNWSGYADTADAKQKFNAVSTEFTVPDVNCADSADGPFGSTWPYGAWVSEWAGLDGFNSKTVEQEGVEVGCATPESSPEYIAWYEMYPLLPVTYTGINPGDAIRVETAQYKNGHYLLSLTDLTNGFGFSATESCPAKSKCDSASAEVITEAPYEDGYLPLADYAQTDYAGTWVEANRTGKDKATLAKSKWWAENAITMVSDTTPSYKESVPGPLEGGADFYTTWKAN